jgi:hypothetical protein
LNACFTIETRTLALGWLIFLIGAAWLLPPLDSHIRPKAATRGFILACCSLLLFATCVGILRYFADAWKRARTASNRTAYIVWLSLETLAAVALLTAALVLAWNTYTIRTAIRWFAWSRDYKAHVLAQPASATGDLKHIEWDVSGWGPIGPTIVYLVFDPTDSLSAAAQSDHPGRFSGVPCEVPRVQRLESQWYAVTFYTEESWGNRNRLNCSGNGG